METDSLTYVAINTRRAVRWGIYLFIFYFIARALFGIGISAFRLVFPKAPPPPTVGFSKLPAILFPENASYPTAFKLETATGELPTFPASMKVFSIPRSKVKLSSLEDVQKKAFGLGYTSQPVEVSPTVYKFDHPTLPSSIEFNIVNGTFSTSSDLALDTSLISQLPPFQQEAASLVSNFLSRAESLPEDVDLGTATYEYLKIDGGQLVRALSQSDAELVRVNLFRKNIDKTEKEEGYQNVVTTPGRGNIWVTLSGQNDKRNQVIASEYHYFPIDYEGAETYPIKTSAEAYSDLQSGKGFIASGGAPDVTIRKVYLAYFDPNQQEQFYQPVVVFEGDGFVAYVPAVTFEYYGE